jgi:hypothetical protein
MTCCGHDAVPVWTQAELQERGGSSARRETEPAAGRSSEGGADLRAASANPMHLPHDEGCSTVDTAATSAGPGRQAPVQAAGELLQQQQPQPEDLAATPTRASSPGQQQQVVCSVQGSVRSVNALGHGLPALLTCHRSAQVLLARSAVVTMAWGVLCRWRRQRRRCCRAVTSCGSRPTAQSASWRCRRRRCSRSTSCRCAHSFVPDAEHERLVCIHC